MPRCKKRPKRRKFFALLENKETEILQAIELVGKHGKKYAFAKARTITGDNWEILLVLGRGARHSEFLDRDNCLELKKRISKGNFETI